MSERQRTPLDDDIDVYGLTHPGKVREENQDHFLICELRKEMSVRLTSIQDLDEFPSVPQRLAFLAMVADGVGAARGGERASRIAVAAVTRYVMEGINAYYTADTTDDVAFTGALEEAALKVHSDVIEHARRDPSEGRMATTLSLFIGIWPRGYLVQVGDSRYYILKDGELWQVSRDQTVGQELVDAGVLAGDQASKLRWAHTLSSAIGGSESAPVVTAIDNDWSYVHLLCSDGLTKHVPDERIRQRLSGMTSAKQACEALLQDALDDGGTDNITLVVGRALPRGAR